MHERDDRADEELLFAWQAGDKHSGAVLWRRHSRAVQRFFRNKVSATVAQDLGQRTAESAFRVQGAVRSFRAYILGIARNKLLDHLREEHTKRRQVFELETFVVEEWAAGPDDWVGVKRERRLLLRALRRLPLPLQLVLELRYWEQLATQDIADVLDVPRNTVRSRLAQGKAALLQQVRRLESSPELLRSTLDSLEAWASRTRGQVRALDLDDDPDGGGPRDDLGRPPPPPADHAPPSVTR